MEQTLNVEKQPPSAPPPYSYTTGQSQPYGPQYGFQPPQPGYPPSYSNSGSFQADYSATSNYGIPPPQTVQPTPVNQQTVIVMGGCPSCRVGVLEDDYTCCGICCAICFFPIGILCCLAMKQKKCTNCKATF